MNLLQDLGLVEEGLAEFAAGQPVTQGVSIGGVAYSVEVVQLPNGPVAPYKSYTGGFFPLLLLVLGDAAAFAAGAPLSIAEKIGDKWYGETISRAATVPPA